LGLSEPASLDTKLDKKGWKNQFSKENPTFLPSRLLTLLNKNGSKASMLR
jgi:hypothetical protein